MDARLVLAACSEIGSDLTPSEAPEDPRQLSIIDLYRRLIKDDEQAGTQNSGELLETVTYSLFERLRPSARWRFLFARLSLPMGSELVRGISSGRLPNREDWANIFKPLSYNAGRGWHLWTAFSLVALISAADIVLILRSHWPSRLLSLSMSIVVLEQLARNPLSGLRRFLITKGSDAEASEPGEITEINSVPEPLAR